MTLEQFETKYAQLFAAGIICISKRYAQVIGFTNDGFEVSLGDTDNLDKVDAYLQATESNPKYW
jgi:hypothetical protein